MAVDIGESEVAALVAVGESLVVDGPWTPKVDANAAAKGTSRNENIARFAGGGTKPGITYGKTDVYCYKIVYKTMHVHDLHATLMHLMGVEHERLTYRYQGRDFRLTDVHGHIIRDILA